MIAKAARAPWTALVLSGGGARGAYEAGVIRYLREELPPRVRAHIRFEIICGSSAGAINCCFLASHSHVPDLQAKALVDMWQGLRIDGIYQVGLRELFNLPKFLFGSRGRGQVDDIVGAGRLGGFFNTSPLEKLVHETIPWKNISTNIAAGDLKALALIATHVGSGKTHVFVQRDEPGLPPWSRDPQVAAFNVQIGPVHALASSAIPWVFPSVEIDGEVYCDGGIKLNTPIAPAIRLGADRLLVIGLKSEHDVKMAGRRFLIDQYPSALFLLGKILNALMVDKTEYDLDRLLRFNAVVEAAQQTVHDPMLSLRGAPYRKIDTLVIRPSEDIAAIAGRHLKEGTIASRAGGLVGPLLRRMAETDEGQANDLLSYFLFDGEFASDLIQMGMRDAHAHRQKIVDFFSA
jgi:NTE family protein